MSWNVRVIVNSFSDSSQDDSGGDRDSNSDGDGNDGDGGGESADNGGSDSGADSCFVAGTKVTMFDGSLKSIEFVESIEELSTRSYNETVYNLALNPGHTYIANNYIVHNYHYSNV